MRERSHFLAFAVFMAFIGVTSADLHAQYVCGDANGDGSVNISDAVWNINYVFLGGAAPDPLCLGEANGDGFLNISDAVWIINYVFTGGAPPDSNCCSDCPSIAIDYDGNVYQVVKIGEQCWMAENLKVTHYRNGDPIPNVTTNNTWEFLTTGAYCDYNNDDGNVDEFGRLYNFYAVVDSRDLAPEGWHVPTDVEWKQLEMYLGMSQDYADATGWRGTDEGGQLKEAGTNHWSTPNIGATNQSGFTALPAGYRGYAGTFSSMGTCAFFWLSSELDTYYAWFRYLDYNTSMVYRFYHYKHYGFSVRCVKD